MDAVILDLDMTLIDSSSAEDARQKRRWSEVYSLIPRFRVYPGVHTFLKMLYDKSIPICVVTSSPRIYCDKVLKAHRVSVHVRVCYHDTRKHKPDPEPYFRALSLMKISPTKNVLACGDAAADILAGHRAGLSTAGCIWGSVDSEALIRSQPHHICQSVSDLTQLISSKAS